MIKRWLRRWLGIKQLESDINFLSHWQGAAKDNKLDGLAGIVDDSTSTASYGGITRVDIDGNPAPLPPELDPFTPAPESQPLPEKGIKGYDRRPNES